MQTAMPRAATHSDLTIRSANARIIRVPLRFTLGTSADVVSKVPIVLLDVLTDEGVIGRAYAFAYTCAGAAAIAALVKEAVEMTRGCNASPLRVAEQLTRRYRLLGTTGAVRMALSILDIALWDAQGIAQGQPVFAMLDAQRRAIPAYDSRGLGLMAPGLLADEALRLIDDMKLSAVKLRLGHAILADDIAAIEAVLQVLPEGIGLMVDYNQALSPDEALQRGKLLDNYGLLWIEEPTRHDDYPAQARFVTEIRTPLQIGENFNGPEAMNTALASNACNYAMPDVARIGGVTGWLQAATLAAAQGMPLSSHLYPEVSLTLLSASPTAHWLEYVDWANAFLAEPLHFADGAAMPSDKPGFGLEWDEAKIAHLQPGSC
jgi:mandelate racemase